MQTEMTRLKESLNLSVEDIKNLQTTVATKWELENNIHAESAVRT